MSGIYIPGMEMPTSCFECKLLDYTDTFKCRVRFESLVKEHGINISRPDWCPLVPVPDHGRLIDADKLGIRDAEKQAYEAYLREKGEFFVEEPLLEYMRGRLEGLTDASGRVRFAPTVIPASKEGEG